MPNDSIVLLSGGLDSAYACLIASEQSAIRLVLTFDYGQRAHEREVAAARSLCGQLGLKHRVITLPFFSELTGHPFFDQRANCPEPERAALDDIEKSQASAKAVWVPNRNGIFINAAAGIAEALNADRLYVGFNAEEGATFPDNSAAFVDATNNALSYSTANHVQVVSPPLTLRKTDIVRELKRHEFDFSLLWSCYRNEAKMCGLCESCQRLKRALDENGVAQTGLFLS